MRRSGSRCTIWAIRSPSKDTVWFHAAIAPDFHWAVCSTGAIGSRGGDSHNAPPQFGRFRYRICSVAGRLVRPSYPHTFCIFASLLQFVPLKNYFPSKAQKERQTPFARSLLDPKGHNTDFMAKVKEKLPEINGFEVYTKDRSDAAT